MGNVWIDTFVPVSCLLVPPRVLSKTCTRVVWACKVSNIGPRRVEALLGYKSLQDRQHDSASRLQLGPRGKSKVSSSEQLQQAEAHCGSSTAQHSQPSKARAHCVNCDSAYLCIMQNTIPTCSRRLRAEQQTLRTFSKIRQDQGPPQNKADNKTVQASAYASLVRGSHRVPVGVAVRAATGN